MSNSDINLEAVFCVKSGEYLSVKLLKWPSQCPAVPLNPFERLLSAVGVFIKKVIEYAEALKEMKGNEVNMQQIYFSQIQLSQI